MKRLLVLAFLLCLLALGLLGGATASEITHCYVVGDSCVVISNFCYLSWWQDCGDGKSWESQYFWKAGWCRAAIYIGVIVGTVEECVDSKALTVAEKVPVSSLNGLLLQQSGGQQQQSGNQQSNSGGGQQQQSGGQQQQSGGQQQQSGGQQQQSGNQQQQPQQPQQPQQAFNFVQDQQNTQKTVVQQQLPQEPPPQPQQNQGAQGQGAQGQASCPNTVTLDGYVARDAPGRGPSCTPSTPAQRGCSAGTYCPWPRGSCGWEKTVRYGPGTQTVNTFECQNADGVVKDHKFNTDMTGCQKGYTKVNTGTKTFSAPSRTTFRYVCW